MGALLMLGAGCNQSEGSVQVDVGSAPLAAAYRVDLYAREAGLDLVEGQSVAGKSVTTLSHVPAGKWALLIQAQNGDQTTIGYYQAQIEVKADQTTEVTAGTYKSGMPGDPPAESSASLTSFGPNGDALFSVLYAASVDSAPAASVDLELSDGDAAAATSNTTNLSVLQRSEAGGPQCGTCFISKQDVEKADAIVKQEAIRPQVSVVNPGETIDLNIITTFRTVTCRRLLTDAQTQHCLIFAEVVNGTPVLTDAKALEIAQGFDSDNPFQNGDSGIYNDTRSRMGSEWTTDGGRDGDPRVFLVFLSSDSIGGTGLFGFFNPADETDSGSSNKGEILYLNADRANADTYDALGTIAHEFTHMIVYNQKIAQQGAFPSGASSENAVLDEGLAVLNEELSGFTYTGTQGGNGFLLGAVSKLLESGFNRRYFQFTGTLADYGAGYMFWRYVHDQLGQDTIKTLVTSTAVGRANVETALSEPFTSFFQKYTQAVALNGQTGLSSDLQFTNLDLFGSYVSRDNTSYQLNGLQGINTLSLPGTLTTTTDLEPWGTIFYRVSGGDGNAVNWKGTGADGISVGVVPISNAK